MVRFLPNYLTLSALSTAILLLPATLNIQEGERDKAPEAKTVFPKNSRRDIHPAEQFADFFITFSPLLLINCSNFIYLINKIYCYDRKNTIHHQRLH